MVNNKMNSVVQREDYSWYGDERVGRTRKYKHTTTIATKKYNNDTMATISAIIGVIISIIDYTITK